MTQEVDRRNADVAAEMQAIVDARRRKRGPKPAMRYLQLERIAARLREYPDEYRFEAGIDFNALGPLQLMTIEWAVMKWYEPDSLNHERQIP